MAGEKVDNVAPRSEPSYWRWGFSLLKLGFSALAVAWVIQTVDLASAWRQFATQDFRLLLAALVVLVLQIILGGLRWHVILRHLQAPAKVLTSLRLCYIAVFFNVWLWGGVGGDVVRGWLSYRGNVPGRTALNSVVLDRVAALAGVAALVLATAPYWMVQFGSPPMASLSAGLAAAGLLGIGVVAQLYRLPQPWQRLRVMQLVRSFSAATGAIFLQPAAAVPTLLLAAAAQALIGLTTYLLARSLAVGVSLLDCLVLMQPVTLITSLPISVGGWGVRETAMIAVFGLVGVSSSAALVLSVQLGLLTMVVSLPGLILWLTLRREDFRGETSTPVNS